ncbi:MAG: type II secretion system protein GspM [Deltaproteobacteria bacterium]|nr:type II secretion system protein GspM [Deltaproteobacteria bacterium]
MELNKREKILILICAAVIIPVLFFQYGLYPIIDYKNDLINKIHRTELKLNQLNEMGESIRLITGLNSKRTNKLDRIVDNLLSQVNIKSQSETVVDDRYKDGQKLVLKLDEINLNELAMTLYRIENQKPSIVIESLELSPSFKNEKLLRANLNLISQ